MNNKDGRPNGDRQRQGENDTCVERTAATTKTNKYDPMPSKAIAEGRTTKAEQQRSNNHEGHTAKAEQQSKRTMQTTTKQTNEKGTRNTEHDTRNALAQRTTNDERTNDEQTTNDTR